MKKLLLLMTLGSFAAMPVVAQEEEDFTQYIVNAGFDEDLTFQVDGTMKEAISTDNSLSDRSWAYIAADSTLYARPKSTSSQSRPDGRKLEAVNGFIGRIKGWTVESSAAFPGCEWVYFGNVPYGLGAEAVPTSDDTNGFLYMPEVPTEFNEDEDNIAAAYMRAGWGGWVLYKQEVHLPCAEYHLEYWTKNCNANASAEPENLTKVICRRDVFQEEEGSLKSTEWTKHEFEFTPVDKFTIQFGFKSANSSSNANPWVLIDGIRLYKIGEADPAELLRSDVYYYNDMIKDSLDFTGLNGDYFYGLLDEAEDKAEELIYEGEDLEKLQASIDGLKALYTTMEEAIEAAKRVETQLIKVQNVLDATNYPGKATLQGVYESTYQLLFSDGKGGDAAAVIAAEAALKDALNDYYFSQPADMENPANYSFLVQHPWMCLDGREPASGVAADVEAAALTNDDKDITGWNDVSSASNRTTGAYFKVGRTCYQLWADNNFTGILDANQELTNLPNGIYSVQMDLITNTDALSDQRVYAASSLGETEGFMTEAGVLGDWPSGDYDGLYPADGTEPWETVTTTGTVIVTDGKLTIGARSTHGDPTVEDISANYRRGCFWFTNVILRYHGQATDAQIAEAIAAREKLANDLAGAMHFAADKKQANDSIAAYNQSKDLDVLNGGIAFAKTSEAKFNEIMEPGKTLPTVAENLADASLAEEIYGNQVDLVKYAYDATNAWINSSEATYTKVDSVLNVAKNYINDFAQSFINGEEYVADFQSQAAKNLVLEGIASAKKKLMPGNNVMLSVEATTSIKEDLSNLMAAADKQNEYEKNPNGTDYTGWILNPNFAENFGWTYDVIKGDGPVKTGQYLNGDESYTYFDSYFSTRGELNVTGFQTVEGLPNGTYKAQATVRTPAVGAFIFAITGTEKADSIFVEIPLQYYTYLDGETGLDTTVVASDKYGPIWQEAFDAYIQGDATEEQTNIAMANGNEGRGWQYLSIDNIVVKDHTLTIGQTTNSALSGKAFEGSWFSVTDWTLTLVEKGNNDDWGGPLTAVREINTLPASADGIFTLDGRRVSKLNRGLYIVVRGGKASKVLVK